MVGWLSLWGWVHIDHREHREPTGRGGYILQVWQVQIYWCYLAPTGASKILCYLNIMMMVMKRMGVMMAKLL